VLAYCSAFKVPVVPSGAVNLTKDRVVAKVSSKSKTVMPRVTSEANLLFDIDLAKVLGDLIFFLIGLLILNFLAKVTPSKSTIELGSISTRSLKYLCHQKFSPNFQPTGIFLANLAILSFVSSALSSAISL